MELDQLAAALVAFQGNVPTIGKGKTAKIPTKGGGSYSYSYADLSSIWDAIRPALKTNGLAVTQTLVHGADGFTGINTRVWHESGQSFGDVVFFDTKGRSPQEVGSAITYFKRYALAAALGLVTDEDDDGAAATTAVVAARSELDDAKAALRAAIQKSGADPKDYVWVKDATEANIDEILGVAEALNMGKVAASV